MDSEEKKKSDPKKKVALCNECKHPDSDHGYDDEGFSYCGWVDPEKRHGCDCGWRHGR